MALVPVVPGTWYPLPDSTAISVQASAIEIEQQTLSVDCELAVGPAALQKLLLVPPFRCQNRAGAHTCNTANVPTAAAAAAAAGFCELLMVMWCTRHACTSIESSLRIKHLPCRKLEGSSSQVPVNASSIIKHQQSRTYSSRS